MNDLSKYSVAELHNEIQSRYGNTLEFKKFKLTIDPSMGGGVYRSNEIYAGTNDSFYSILKNVFNVSLFIDIGANIGLETLQVNTVFPQAKKVLIEPNMHLIPLIKTNLKQNNVTNYHVIQGIVGDKECEVKWQRNINFSVDSRVNGLDKDFVYEVAKQITLQSILDNYSDKSDNVLIKVDTQGYEERVVNGGFEYLSNSRNYYLRMEFAPFWLKSQGTCPMQFLSFMINNFDVAELPRLAFKTCQIEEIFSKKLLISDVERFIEYVKDQGKDDKGWVELIVKNRQITL
jgi:FkbM family methyltransferase